ncbi:glycoside hydrolase family 3 N-terminal domain-containing protein [Streptomyces sp. 6N223]|uniref:glycoside hydrolase family 3 N-terminal domain-containing protein n=1 Tax=Streptomyces sp. 6N223 TaxID=3457412 RepID=UPI003FD6434C
MNGPVTHPTRRGQRRPRRPLATAKQYVGDGGTTGGDDQGDTQVSEEELRAVHPPPFEEAVARGVGAVMISCGSFNGDKLHGHDCLINDVLKGELGFDGFVVSDWARVDQLVRRRGLHRGGGPHLYGDHAPTGTLPMSWMASADQRPVNAGDGKEPLFPCGFGLTYRPFTRRSAGPPGRSRASATEVTK